MHSTEIRSWSASLMEGPLSQRRCLKRFLCGLVVLGLLFTTMARARSDFMYWTEGVDNLGGRILRANLDGTELTTLVTGLDSKPEGPYLDLAGGQMYWATGGARSGDGKIWRANLDGTGMTTLVTGLDNPGTLGLDIGGGQMYWVYGFFGTGGIQRANVDGSGLTTLVSGINGPRAATFDFPGGMMYLSQGTGGQEGFISRYNLDGSGRETFLRGLSKPTVMALDIPKSKIYWADEGSFTIRRASTSQVISEPPDRPLFKEPWGKGDHPVIGCHIVPNCLELVAIEYGVPVEVGADDATAKHDVIHLE